MNISKRVVSIIMSVTMLCIALTGCSFSVENNLTKSPLEYNTSFIEDKLDISTEDASEYAKILDEQGCGKLKTTLSKVVNGEGFYKLGDGKNKYVFIIENSLITRIETEDGNIIKDFSKVDIPEVVEDVSEEGITDETGKVDMDTILGTSNNDTKGTSETDGFVVSLDFADVYETDTKNAKTVPNGNLKESTVLYNLNGVTLGEIHDTLQGINPSINIQLFDDIYASTVIEENFLADSAGVDKELGKVAEQGYVLLAALLADKFNDLRFSLEYTEFAVRETTSGVVLYLTDGGNQYAIEIQNNANSDTPSILVDGKDYTSSIYTEEQIIKYYNILRLIGLEDAIMDLDDNDYEDYYDLKDSLSGTSNTTSTTNKATGKVSGKLSSIETIHNYDIADIESKINAYYNSTIANVKQDEYDLYNGSYESAYITMSNGATCKYFYSDTGAEVYDTTSTYEDIWASWK